MAASATDHDPVATPPVSTLDILLGEDQDLPRRRGLPELPEGWQHAALVRRLEATEPRRREGLLSIAFAVAAVVWAPLGILAVLAGTEGVFLALSALTAVALLSPRPTGVAAADLGPALARTWAGVVRAARAVRRRAAGLLADFRAAGDRAGEVSAPSGLPDPLSRWVDGQSTPSSTR